MRACVIDSAVLARARQVLDYAETHRETLADLLRRMNKPHEGIPGENPGHVLNIFDGFRVVISIEQQPDPVGWCYHVSVSVSARRGKVPLPHPAAVQLILTQLKLPGLENAWKHAIAKGYVEFWLPYKKL